VVACVHGLKKIERLGTANLADNDALWTHTQAVFDKLAHGNFAASFKVWRPSFETHHMRLLELQFGGVLAGDDALIGIYKAGQTVQQRRLAGPGTAGHDGIYATAADDFEDFGTFLGNRSKSDQLFEGKLVLFEFADRESRAVDRQRRRNDIDA